MPTPETPTISILVFSDETGDMQIASWWEEITEQDAVARICQEMTDNEDIPTTEKEMDENLFYELFNVRFDVRRMETSVDPGT